MKFINATACFFKSNDKTFYLLLLVLLVGTFLRVYGLSDQTYWHDEIITLKVAQGSLESILRGSRPPIYLALAQFWFEIFGVSEIATRLLSIIFGVSSIVLIFIVGKMLFNRNVGLISAFFMAFSVYQIYYSQEIRYYSLYEFLTLASFYFYIRLLKSKSYINTVLYIVSTVLAFYTHDMAILIIPVQNLYLLIKYKKHRSIFVRWFITQLIVLISIAPRLIDAFGTKAIGEGGPNWISPAIIWSPLYTIYRFMGVSVDFQYFLYGCIAIIILFVGTVVYFFVIREVKRKKSQNQTSGISKVNWSIKSETILVLVWLIVPIALLFIASKVFKPMYLSRYLICAAPACYILAAVLIEKINKPILKTIILIAFIILNLPGMYYHYTGSVREDWRGVGKFIVKNDEGGQTLILIPRHYELSFDWYNNKGGYQYCNIPILPTELSELFRRCKLDDYDQFWIVFTGVKFDKDISLYHFNHQGKDYLIIKEGEFDFLKDNSATLFSFEKVKE